MDKTQEEKFREFNDEQEKNDGTLHSVFNCVRRNAWQACLEANGIGEEPSSIEPTVIEVGGYFKIDWNSRPWASEVRVAYAKKDTPPDKICDLIVTIPRPVPVWAPQDGEAVLFEDDGRAMAGFIKNGILYARGFMCSDWKKNKRVAIFDASKIGKPWSEI